MTRLPGLDMSTGSLGMGISAAMGMALGARLTGRDVRAFVMLGDGECQEGEVWEAAMAAPRYHLDNLVAIVDHNKLQQFGWRGDGPDGRVPPEAPGELVAKWTAFGWRVIEADGHDMRDILRAFDEAAAGDGRPVVIIAHTVKGKGVSFMENRYYWHTRILQPDEFATAMADLGEPLQAGASPADALPVEADPAAKGGQR
jgi:transketolase